LYREITPKELQELIKKLFERVNKKQPISIIDFYGVLLEHEFLHINGDHSSPSLKDLMQTKLLKQFKVPFPIVSAIIVKNTSSENYSRQIEFTPTDVNIPEFAITIPSISFGAKHEKGKPVRPYYNNDGLGFIVRITYQTNIIDGNHIIYLFSNYS
jgi:predicted transcriptional regulator